MKTSGKIGSNGVYVSENVEKRFETDIYTHTYINLFYQLYKMSMHFRDRIYIYICVYIYIYIYIKVKQSRYRPGVAQRVPGN
jgi:hypothetical protein